MNDKTETPKGPLAEAPASKGVSAYELSDLPKTELKDSAPYPRITQLRELLSGGLTQDERHRHDELEFRLGKYSPGLKLSTHTSMNQKGIYTALPKEEYEKYRAMRDEYEALELKATQHLSAIKEEDDTRRELLKKDGKPTKFAEQFHAEIPGFNAEQKARYELKVERLNAEREARKKAADSPDSVPPQIPLF